MILKDYKDALSLLMSKITDKDHATEKAYNALNNFSDTFDDQYIHSRLILENMSDIFWIINLEGEIIFINGSVKDLLGYSPNEMVGRKLYDFMCPLHAYKVGTCKACVESMKQNEFICEEMWMIHKDGKTRKVLEVNSNHVFKYGKMIEIYGIGRDITSRIQYERSMKKKNQQMGIIQELTTSINQYLSLNNLDQLLNRTCKTVVTTMHVDLCSIFMLEDSQFILKGSYGKHKGPVDESIFLLNESISKRIIKQSEPFVFSSKEGDSNFEGSDKLESKIEKIVFVPLSTNNITIGVLVLVPGPKFEKDHLPLYAVLGNNIAFASEKSQLHQNIKSYYLDIIMTLVAAMEAKDSYTQGHSIRVSDYSVKIGSYLGLSKENLEELKIAGILHDIGKIGIRNSILTKPGKLSTIEYDEIKRHPDIGIKILERINISQDVKDAILYHHLREDLTGYPMPLYMLDQPLFAKIVGAADALDAMTSYRAYKAKMSTEEVIEEFKKHSGTQFNDEISRIIITLLEKKEIVPLNTRKSQSY